ncbi:MAG: pyridoxal phosphate-dependent aminotransferase [Planctomycetes bacterium]|nr:pyridoxal phosphate-dependent aminotransferase [Planctomycetota bacterium]
MKPSCRAEAIPASLTFTIDARVNELRAAGVDVVGLGAGQPDFPCPPAALEGARRYLEESGGKVGYTASGGIAPLRKAAAEHVSRVAGVTYAPSQLVVTNGAKEALALAIAALCDDGDEIALPAPSWLSYEPMANAFGARAAVVQGDERRGFRITPEALEAAIGPKTRAVLLNSPCNPTGSVYPREELLALAEVIVARDLWIVSDEIYWPFVFEGSHVSPASLPGMSERTIVVNGLSKSHSMTGWRIGLLAAPPAVADAVDNLKSHLSSNASTPAQYAALGALTHDDGQIGRMREAFRRRRELACTLLGEIEGVEFHRPEGAFYVFPRVDRFYGGAISGSLDFCTALLEEGRLAAVPGAVFGEDRCIRLSIATGDDAIAEGIRRLGAFCATLRARVG